MQIENAAMDKFGPDQAISAFNNKQTEFLQMNSGVVPSASSLVLTCDLALQKLSHAEYSSEKALEEFLIDLPWEHAACIKAMQYIIKNRSVQISQIRKSTGINLLKELKPHMVELRNIVNSSNRNKK